MPNTCKPSKIVFIAKSGKYALFIIFDTINHNRGKVKIVLRNNEDILFYQDLLGPNKSFELDLNSRLPIDTDGKLSCYLEIEGNDEKNVYYLYTEEKLPINKFGRREVEVKFNIEPKGDILKRNSPFKNKITKSNLNNEKSSNSDHLKMVKGSSKEDSENKIPDQHKEFSNKKNPIITSDEEFGRKTSPDALPVRSQLTENKENEESRFRTKPTVPKVKPVSESTEKVIDQPQIASPKGEPENDKKDKKIREVENEINKIKKELLNKKKENESLKQELKKLKKNFNIERQRKEEAQKKLNEIEDVLANIDDLKSYRDKLPAMEELFKKAEFIAINKDMSFKQVIFRLLLWYLKFEKKLEEFGRMTPDIGKAWNELKGCFDDILERLEDKLNDWQAEDKLEVSEKNFQKEQEVMDKLRQYNGLLWGGVWEKINKKNPKEVEIIITFTYLYLKLKKIAQSNG